MHYSIVNYSKLRIVTATFGDVQVFFRFFVVRYWWLPIGRKSMDSVDIVHGHCLAGVLERGQCPLSPWTMSTQSMGNVHSVHGQCPLRPWTMSAESMDIVHSVHGLFPWVFTTLYLVKNYSNPTKLNAYIQFTMLVIYISWHTMSICPSILIDLLTVTRPSALKQIP